MWVLEFEPFIQRNIIKLLMHKVLSYTSNIN